VPDSTVYVLDSWPILEWLQRRSPAFVVVDRLLEQSVRGEVTLRMSEVNLGEVLYSCWRKFPLQEASRVLADIETFPIEYTPTDRKLVEEAARIKTVVSASYADCFAAALAMREGAQLVTGDNEFLKMSERFPLQLLWLGA
jgi:predicted nucleic acid-binding protein